MRGLFIGTGAAGNKAVINLVEKGVIDIDDAILLNSTLKDVPDQYKDKAIKFADDIDGCGKERTEAKYIITEAIQKGRLSLDGILMEYHEKIFIVTSMEGGTGSGSAPLLLKHILDTVQENVWVEIIAFKGFEDDARGLANSVEFFQELSDDTILEVIDNASFLKEAGGNQKKAQKLANDELVKRVKVALGQLIVDSEDNMDSTDLYKVTNTAGYLTAEYREIDEKISTPDQFNRILNEMLDESHSIGLEVDDKKIARLAVIINLKPSSQENIDYTFSAIKEKLGTPYEVFKHIEYTDEFPEFISFVASGMGMPIQEVKDIAERYNKMSNRTNKSKDSFFNDVIQLQGNAEDDMFNMGASRRRRPNRRSTDGAVRKQQANAKEQPKNNSKDNSEF